MAQDMRWLEIRGRGYYAVLDVPRLLQPAVGKKRLIRSLKTRDPNVARARRHKVLGEFQRTLEEARQRRPDRPSLDEALGWREALEAANDTGRDASGPDDNHAETFDDPTHAVFYDRLEAIRQQEGEAAAIAFHGLATGTATPLLHHVDAFLAEGGTRGPGTVRTQRQYRSDLETLAAWLHTIGVATIEGVNKKIAGRYVSETIVGAGMDRGTGNRRISAASAYWRWLDKRGHAEGNPWTGQSLSNGPRRGDDERSKRPFTSEEISRLFASDLTHDPELADAMRCAALTGMRLEELFRLTVADCAGGWLAVRRSKTPAGRRRVPVHSGLGDLIARRTAGKAADAFLFHEAGPTHADRERSAAISKRFGRFRQSVQVHERAPGRRHSAVDFHSFRRWFVTEARNAGIDTAVVAVVVGHKREGMTDGTYHGGPNEALKRACVEAVRLPPAKSLREGE